MSRTILVTGGAQGIGFGIAARFAQEGAEVVLLDRDAEQLALAAASIPRAKTVVADVTDDQQVAAAAEQISATGPVDVLVNNAGIEVVGTLIDVPWEQVRAVFEVNVFGALRCSRAFLPLLSASTSPSIVNMSSAAGTAGSPFLGSYSMAKAAVIRMTEALAFELRAANVRVNAVCPAMVGPTRMVEALAAPFQEVGLPVEQLLAKQGRLGEVDEVADLVMFLASEDAALINGAHYLIDGGLTAGVL